MFIRNNSGCFSVRTLKGAPLEQTPSVFFEVGAESVNIMLFAFVFRWVKQAACMANTRFISRNRIPSISDVSCYTFRF
jgi:hypothetical protein